MLDNLTTFTLNIFSITPFLFFLSISFPSLFLSLFLLCLSFFSLTSIKFGYVPVDYIFDRPDNSTDFHLSRSDWQKIKVGIAGFGIMALVWFAFFLYLYPTIYLNFIFIHFIGTLMV